MFGCCLSIQVTIKIAGIWAALLSVNGLTCKRAHKAEWANETESWDSLCPYRKGIDERCYVLNCSDGHNVRSEWGCVSEFDDGNLGNCKSGPNFFEDNGLSCACQIGEKDKDMSNDGMAIPLTTTTTTTTITTTTAPPHFCIQAKIESPESTGNETLSEKQCKPEEAFCFFYNCTSGTDPNKRIAEWGCSKDDYSSEICTQKLDAFGYKLKNVDNEDLCKCFIGWSNKEPYSMAQIGLNELPRDDKSFSSASRSIGKFEAIFMTCQIVIAIANAITWRSSFLSPSKGIMSNQMPSENQQQQQAPTQSPANFDQPFVQRSENQQQQVQAPTHVHAGSAANFNQIVVQRSQQQQQIQAPMVHPFLPQHNAGGVVHQWGQSGGVQPPFLPQHNAGGVVPQWGQSGGVQPPFLPQHNCRNWPASRHSRHLLDHYHNQLYLHRNDNPLCFVSKIRPRTKNNPSIPLIHHFYCLRFLGNKLLSLIGVNSGTVSSNEPVHFSRECPQAGGGGEGVNSGTVSSNEPVHFSRECPQAGGGGECVNSGTVSSNEPVHFSRECPQAGGGGECVNSGTVSSNEPVHFSRECPQAGGGGECVNSGTVSSNEPVHFSRECPQAGSGGECVNSGTVSSNEPVHFSRECPQAGGGGECVNSGTVSSNEPVHFSRECPQAGGGGECVNSGTVSSNEPVHFSRECPQAGGGGEGVIDDGGDSEDCDIELQQSGPLFS
uniref:Uncharacterized protein n=1 Tax=Globodera rostochiensis TaxID=31243 RepID=A0A914HLI5_GLORO